MAIPKISDEHVKQAIQFIDVNGVPDKNKSTKYELVLDNGKKYPPKYVIAVAGQIATGNEINLNDFNAVEAKGYFETRGYMIETKQEKYEITITANDIVSTDEKFSMQDLGLGDNYKPIDVYFKKADGTIITRKREKSENRISNQTLPRLTCQIYESQLESLSDVDKENFPICKYSPSNELIRGIYPTVDEYKKIRKGLERMTYRRKNGSQFVFYSWNVFSTLIFVKECLKRFGDEGDSFVLVYREKGEEDKAQGDQVVMEDIIKTSQESQNPYSEILLKSKNIILRGAPGTGKTYLAKQIAADIISNGYTDQYTDLNDEQKKQVEFVQFHPSYDYSDFVEGLRPVMNGDGTMGFELQDGIFKRFVNLAIRNYEYTLKNQDALNSEQSAVEAISEFVESVDFGKDQFRTVTDNVFNITEVNDKYIHIYIPGNELAKELNIRINDLKRMLESEKNFEKVGEIHSFFGKQFRSQEDSYAFALYKEIQNRIIKKEKRTVRQEGLKKYIFIIDEINRGEISKILGELFFSIDPGYRGKNGEVSTQYANMHEDPDEKFYIPDNVYIIGTMNDIDRSVDSFDFAMRRRFRFIEVKAESSQGMLESLENDELKDDAVKRMNALNEAIKNVEDLNENYQIGASYFLKLRSMTADELWTDSLEPLLSDYVRGMYDEKKIMAEFARAYGYNASEEVMNESEENQGQL